MDTVESLITADKPLVTFSKSTCHSIKSPVYSLGANPRVYEVDDINGQQLERELQEFGQNPTVPAVFIGQEFVGGPQEISSLHIQGKLVQTVAWENLSPRPRPRPRPRPWPRR